MICVVKSESGSHVTLKGMRRRSWKEKIERYVGSAVCRLGNTSVRAPPSTESTALRTSRHHVGPSSVW